MQTFQFVGDIVEENGLTVKKNNQKLIHNIPLGTIVEISYESSYEDEENTNGLRLFVVQHLRDCDGTPLYGLSFNKKAGEILEQATRDEEQATRDEEQAKRNGDHFNINLIRTLLWMYKGAITGGYDEGSLNVVVND